MSLEKIANLQSLPSVIATWFDRLTMSGCTRGDGPRNGAFGDSICIMLPMDSRRVLRRLEADGWYVHRIVVSHHQMKHPDKSGTITVPHPRKDLKIGTILSIEKQSGIKLRR